MTSAKIGGWQTPRSAQIRNLLSPPPPLYQQKSNFAKKPQHFTIISEDNENGQTSGSRPKMQNVSCDIANNHHVDKKKIITQNLKLKTEKKKSK